MCTMTFVNVMIGIAIVDVFANYVSGQLRQRSCQKEGEAEL